MPHSPALKHTVTGHTIKVGDGATRIMYSDRQAFTVVQICTPQKIVVQRDTATRVDKNGMSTDQIYEFSRNPSGAKVALRLCQSGWQAKGGEPWSVGSRQEYHDYSF